MIENRRRPRIASLPSPHAHALEPVVRIGHAGVTDGVVADIARGLEAHELIKVTVGRVLVLRLPRPDD
jgi:RNA-binding protein YhbY